MATEGGVHETFSRGKDGKYQIRIESYDPARNTMKAIWLVSRSERVLTELVSTTLMLSPLQNLTLQIQNFYQNTIELCFLSLVSPFVSMVECLVY